MDFPLRWDCDKMKNKIASIQLYLFGVMHGFIGLYLAIKLQKFYVAILYILLHILVLGIYIPEGKNER